MSYSADPDGTVKQQDWDLDGDGQFDDATGPLVKRTFTTPGARRVGLRVTDQLGTSSTLSQTITIKAPLVQAPTPPPAGPSPTPDSAGRQPRARPVRLCSPRSRSSDWWGRPAGAAPASSCWRSERRRARGCSCAAGRSPARRRGCPRWPGRAAFASASSSASFRRARFSRSTSAAQAGSASTPVSRSAATASRSEPTAASGPVSRVPGPAPRADADANDRSAWVRAESRWREGFSSPGRSRRPRPRSPSPSPSARKSLSAYRSRHPWAAWPTCRRSLPRAGSAPSHAAARPPPRRLRQRRPRPQPLRPPRRPPRPRPRLPPPRRRRWRPPLRRLRPWRPRLPRRPRRHLRAALPPRPSTSTTPDEPDGRSPNTPDRPGLHPHGVAHRLRGERSVPFVPTPPQARGRRPCARAASEPGADTDGGCGERQRSACASAPPRADPAGDPGVRTAPSAGVRCAGGRPGPGLQGSGPGRAHRTELHSGQGAGGPGEGRDSRGLGHTSAAPQARAARVGSGSPVSLARGAAAPPARLPQRRLLARRASLHRVDRRGAVQRRMGRHLPGAFRRCTAAADKPAAGAAGRDRRGHSPCHGGRPERSLRQPGRAGPGGGNGARRQRGLGNVRRVGSELRPRR